LRSSAATGRARLAGLLWLAVVAAIGVQQLHFWRSAQLDTDVLALLPHDDRDPVQERATRALVATATRKVFVLVGAPDWALTQRAASLAGAELARAGVAVVPAAGTDADGAALLEFFAPHRESLLGDAQRDWLGKATPQELADAALLRGYQPASGVAALPWLQDPLGLWSDWLTERAGATPVRPRDGLAWLRAEELDWALLSVETPNAAFAVSGAQPLREALERIRAALRELAPEARVLAAGVPLYAESAAARANQEIQTIGFGSLLAVLLLVWLTFRTVRPIVLVALSLLVGCCAGLTVTALLFGRVHVLTLVFGASLVGVAEDYGFHYFAARQGRAVAERYTILRALLPGLALALLTSVVAYLALGVAPFPGLRQMAVFSAVGLCAAFLTVLCWFPLLDTRELPATPFARRFAATLLRWPRWGAGRMSAASVTAIAAIMILGAVGLARLRTQDDVRALQSAAPVLVSEQRALDRLLRLPSPSQFYLVGGASEEDVLRQEEALRERLRALQAARQLGGYAAVSQWVPSGSRQRADAALVRAANSAARTAVTGGSDPGAAAAVAAAQTPLTLTGWSRSGAARAAPGLWLGLLDGRYYSVVQLHGVLQAAIPALAAAATGLPGVRWVDTTANVSALLQRYRVVITLLLLAGYAGVLLALWLRFGRSAWRALLPTAAGSVLTLAVFGLVGQPLQLFVVLGLLLLLGMGVDYGIFLLEHPEDGSVWLAIALAGFSTLLSFGLLALSSTPALRAFGLTMLIGESIIWILTPYLRNAPRS
jgi:predicted exporter